MLKKLHGIYPKLYGNLYDEEKMDERYLSLLDAHQAAFPGKAPMLFSASGRTEIAGNHTDHNLGLVIGASINLDTLAAVTPREDRIVVFRSEGYPLVSISLQELEAREEEKNTTSALLRGIARAFHDKGYEPTGFNATVTSTVLPGSGLSSSASVEVLVASIFNHLSAADALSTLDLAKIGQYAENHYFGKPCGLLDQVSCANGGLVAIDFKEKDNPRVTPLAVDFSSHGLDLVITDTRGSHADLTEEYAAVPPEMKEVAHLYGKEVLREMEEEDMLRDIKEVREHLKNDRAILRAYHFFEENKRVQAMEKALKRGHIRHFLKMVQESGDSSFRFLQNVYPSSSPKDQGVSLALALSDYILDGKGAYRVHGGGFAGTIQAYVPKAMTEKYIAGMEALYGKGCSTLIAIRELPVGRIL